MHNDCLRRFRYSINGDISYNTNRTRKATYGDDHVF
jgi:hypothetical protein